MIGWGGGHEVVGNWRKTGVVSVPLYCFYFRSEGGIQAPGDTTAWGAGGEDGWKKLIRHFGGGGTGRMSVLVVPEMEGAAKRRQRGCF